MSLVLSVKDLTKVYDTRTIIHGVSFDIQQGEIVGLVGPNGAGKTTILHMLLALLQPSSGNITIFGKELSLHREEILERVNFAASYSHLPYNLTLYENLKVFSALYGIKVSKKDLDLLLHDFHLYQYRNMKSGTLSSGEQMRLALAKAFLNHPKLLLLDEPTSSLDPAMSLDLREKIIKKAKEIGGTIIWTSHDMSEIESVCDRVIFLLSGKMVANDTPERLRIQFQKTDLKDIFVSLVRSHPQS